MDFTFDILALLFCIALIAGLIDAMAGGGGLITIPALLAVGLSPAMALGTNKLQACGGSFSASLYFIRKKAVNFRQIWLLILMTFIGSSVGTILVQQLDVESLKVILPFFVFFIGIYFLLSPNLDQNNRQQRISYSLFAFTLALGIGFYDGVFGPATGSFFTMGFILLLGFNLTKAVAHAKVLNFTSNIASLLFFLLGGAVVWKVGLIMMLGQFIGGNIGARIVMTKGKTIIRPLIVTMSFIMVTKMLWNQGYFDTLFG